MFDKLTKDEKLAAIGVFKYVVNANGTIDEGEIQKVSEFVNEKGFSDFYDLLNEFDKNYKNIEDFYELLQKATEKGKDILLDEAYELAVSDGYATPGELKIFDIMAKIWNIDKEKLLKQVSGE